MGATIAEPRHQRLTAATDKLHDELHTVVASLEPFSSRARFASFVHVQYLFQRTIEPLYADPVLQKLLPDLSARSRRAAAEADLVDLGITPPVLDSDPPRLNVSQALGWLFVSEGSTLGAALLLKHVKPLGLSETFGARHLAANPEGRARHWKRFTDALNTLELTEQEDAETIEGAQAAFRYFGELLRQAGGH